MLYCEYTLLHGLAVSKLGGTLQQSVFFYVVIIMIRLFDICQSICDLIGFLVTVAMFLGAVAAIIAAMF